MSTIQEQIETRIAATEPDVDVLLAEVVQGGMLRVFIDHPEGVSLALCERVTQALADLRESYSIEVSSPGTERPLTKPDHFRRFLGRRARIRTRDAHVAQGAQGEARRSFTGELVGASDEEITLAAPDGIVAIPYTDIHRSHLVEE